MAVSLKSTCEFFLTRGLIYLNHSKTCYKVKHNLLYMWDGTICYKCGIFPYGSITSQIKCAPCAQWNNGNRYQPINPGILGEVNLFNNQLQAVWSSMVWYSRNLLNSRNGRWSLHWSFLKHSRKHRSPLFRINFRPTVFQSEFALGVRILHLTGGLLSID